MKERIYYGRDDDNRPIVTVCLLEGDFGFARGVAACSPMDNPCKRTGRKIAKERARYAVMNKSQNCVVSSMKGLLAFSRAGMDAADFNWTKSAYNPALTNFETKLIFGDGIC